MLRASVILTVGLTAIILAGCSSEPNLDSYSVGPHGHQIRLAAAEGQQPAPAVAGGTSAGSSALPGAINYATTLKLPDSGSVRVAVSVLSRPVTAAHANWIINDYFNNDPERLTTWHGTPADVGVRTCNTPSGPCSGYLGGLQVFRGNALFNVTIDSDSSDTAWAVLRSIRIPSDG